uniref:(northern house mosquito) hypothetical protein n=1 Tax=Culex pipiens TaxID=7175 RepID=A0A8D8DDN2_CULPI
MSLGLANRQRRLPRLSHGVIPVWSSSAKNLAAAVLLLHGELLVVLLPERETLEGPFSGGPLRGRGAAANFGRHWDEAQLAVLKGGSHFFCFCGKFLDLRINIVFI